MTLNLLLRNNCYLTPKPLPFLMKAGSWTPPRPLSCNTVGPLPLPPSLHTPESNREDRTSSSVGSAGALSGRLLRALVTSLPQIKSVSCSMAWFMGYGPSLSISTLEGQTALGECFVCVSMCVITLDTADLGVKLGWESSVLSILFLPQQEEADGEGQEKD